ILKLRDGRVPAALTMPQTSCALMRIRNSLCLLSLWLCVFVVSERADAATACENLTTLTLSNVKITQAVTEASHCRVTAVATPTNDSKINFEVWLPPSTSWNGRLMGIGNNGFQGAINYDDMRIAMGRGYATVGSDAGHPGDDLRFAEGHPEK